MIENENEITEIAAEQTTAISVPSRTLLAALSAADPFRIDSKMYRPVLENFAVKIYSENSVISSMIVEATDSFTATEITAIFPERDATCSQNGEVKFCFGAGKKLRELAAVLAQAKTASEQTKITVNHKNHTVFFSSLRQSLLVEAEQAEYPNFANLYPAENAGNEQCVYNATYLARIEKSVQAARKTLGCDAPNLHLVVSSALKPSLFTWEIPAHKISARVLIMPIRDNR